jgi:hypothetical protein
MSSAAVPSAEPAKLSEAARIVDAFVAPGKTFNDLRRSAAWWGPLVLIIIVSTAFVYVVDQKIGFRKVTENQVQLSPKASQRIEQLPPDQRERTLNTQASFTRNISYGFPAIIVVWNIIVAAVLLATFKFGVSADINFKRSLAIVFYAGLPLLVKSVLAIISVVAGAAPDSFTFQNPVATNPGYFLNPADSPFIYSLATAIDIFMLWTLTLTALGFTYVSKARRGTAFAIVFGWYAIFALGSAGFGALFS